jgi:hypothetical protein
LSTIDFAHRPAAKGRALLEKRMARGEKEKTGGSLLPVLVVFGSGLAIIVVLIVFTGPAGLNLILAVGGVLAFAGLHYILWGWWLSDWIRRRDAADHREENEDE